jgi:uncharacterized protein
MATLYDPLYLEGIEHFNRREYFESHEVWESLWKKEAGPAKRFYKGLIQAAVALHHLNRGNLAGAKTLFARSRSYLRPYRPRYLGVDVEDFLTRLGECIEGRGCTGNRPQAPAANRTIEPVIRLDAVGL